MSAIAVGKVLRSAVANAENNDELDPEELFVSACFADEGTTIKRWRPRARGRATRIRKRTSHITVIVSRLPEEQLARLAGPPPGRAAGPAGPPGGRRPPDRGRPARPGPSGATAVPSSETRLADRRGARRPTGTRGAASTARRRRPPTRLRRRSRRRPRQPRPTRPARRPKRRPTPRTQPDAEADGRRVEAARPRQSTRSARTPRSTATPPADDEPRETRRRTS